MMLTKEIAIEIVKETMMRLNRNINIMDHMGKIIASGDPDRVEQLHEGALEVLRTGKTIILRENNLHQWEKSLPGINLPIEFQNQIIGVIGITGEPEEIMEFGELVKMITEMMISQSFLASRLESKQRMKELVFESIIQPKPNQEVIQQRLNLLGIHLQPPYQVGLLEIGETRVEKLNLIKMLEEILGWKDSLIGFFSVNRLFILFSGKTETGLKRRLEEMQAVLKSKSIPFRIGLGTPVLEQGNIHNSLEESKCALLIGGDLDQKLISYEEIEIRALIGTLDKHAKHKFINRLLNHVPDKMIETLEAFFSNNLNIGESANKLYIHRNTFIYRIKKIKEDTGYDPQVFEDAVALQLAIWIHQMSKTETH
ncbi:CdaR family transcriptional regulator [Bacillus taeanensis]|uniref:Transcriptional regulator n=1 Tax=Bacillus taeanensis TaxID=273032 RepID=A0A366XVN9_9BACI|nr:sugar diacid recognition domain-containing protein [Bacillus taeanensis]RBW68204.1 hypothetical protein DS031_17650 [Bacillus taeanensis]